MILSIPSFIKLRNKITSQTVTVKGQIDPNNHETDFLLMENVRDAINAPNGITNK